MAKVKSNNSVSIEKSTCSNEEFYTTSVIKNITAMQEVINSCYEILTDNLSYFKHDISLKSVLTLLAEEYITNIIIQSQTKDLEADDLQSIAIKIIATQFTIIANNDSEISLSKEEKEYLEKIEIDENYKNILDIAKGLVETDKCNYKENIFTDKEKKNSIPIIECLMFYENEQELKNRLEEIVKYNLCQPNSEKFFKDTNGRTILHYAIIKGNINIVRELCKLVKNCNEDTFKEFLNFPDSKGRAALHFAVKGNNYEIVKLLLDEKIDLTIEDGFKRKALHALCVVDSPVNKKIVNLLLSTEELKLDDKDNYGRTPLHLAAMHNNIYAISGLKEVGAKIDNRDKHERTPLHLAAMNDNIHAINKLIEVGAKIDDKDTYGRTPLHMAAMHGKINAISRLIEIDRKILDDGDAYERTPLHLSCLNGQIGSVKLLLEKKDNRLALDIYKKTPLYLAIQKDKIKIVKKFWIDSVKNDIETKDNRSFISSDNPFKNPDLFISSEHSWYKTEDLVIHLAAKYNSVSTLIFLYTCQKFNFNTLTSDRYSNTPLHHASYRGNYDVVELLLKFSGNILTQNSSKQIPLYSSMMTFINNNVEKHVDEQKEKEKEIKRISGKIQVAMKLIDYDYSVLTKKHYNGKYVFSSLESVTSREFSDNYIEIFFNNAQKDEYLDQNVGSFVQKVCAYLKKFQKHFPGSFGYNVAQQHIPLIIRVAATNNKQAIEDFINLFKLGSFYVTYPLDKKNIDILNKKINNKQHLIKIFEPIISLTNNNFNYEIINLSFGINAIKDDLDEFKKAQTTEKGKKIFINKFIKMCMEEDEDCGVTCAEHVYSLLLVTAIVHDYIDIVHEILKDDHKNILTATDSTGYSPISRTFYSGNEEILETVQGYIKDNLSNKESLKFECDDEDRASILTIMRCPKFELTKQMYEEILEPLYLDIEPFRELLNTFENYY